MSRNAAIVLLALLAWWSAAMAAGWAGFLEKMPTAAVPLTLWGLVAVLLVLFWRWSVLREWVLFVDLRVLVAFHVLRFVGYYFLVLYERGELPYAFAVPGGWGDIIVAVRRPAAGRVGSAGRPPRVAALPRLERHRPARHPGRRHHCRQARARRPRFDGRSLELPLALLPTFIVPIIIATHFFIFYRLFGQQAEPEAA